MTKVTKIKTILQYIFLIIASFLSIFPLWYMLSGATNTSMDVIAGRIYPGTNLINNFKSLIAHQDLGRAFFNSCRNAILLTFLSIFICSIAGYGFEIYHDKHKDRLMAILLMAMMVPFVAIIIPLFRMFSQLHLVNTMIAFVLPSISTPFLIMLFRQSARSFPLDLIGAARIDGLSEVGIFFRVFIPTMKSTYAAAGTIVFMNAWNSYLWPKVVLQRNTAITMPMLVANLMSGWVIDYGMLMLGVSICTIPTAIVFFCLQKSFAAGITGSVK